MTTHQGIDWSMGHPVNRNLTTEIRYGVIPQNAVLQAWADSSEPDYSGCTCDENDECDYCECEPRAHVLDDGEYKATSDEYGDIFVIESPYFTYAQFCSPCAPGACHLLNPLEEKIDDNRAYCFGPDWFDTDDGEEIPYPIYRVDTGEQVYPQAELSGLSDEARNALFNF